MTASIPRTEIHLGLIAPLFEQLQPHTPAERVATANALEQMIKGVETYLSAAPKESQLQLQEIRQRLIQPALYEPHPRYQLQFQTTLIETIRDKIQELRTKESIPPPEEEGCRIF